MTKLNAEAVLSNNSGICSMAAIARDGEGRFLGAYALVLVEALIQRLWKPWHAEKASL
jgi:hypothetical protein